MSWYKEATDIQKIIVSLSTSEHMGDVNNDLPYLCDAVGLERGEWSDEKQRYVFPWGPGEEE